MCPIPHMCVHLPYYRYTYYITVILSQVVLGWVGTSMSRASEKGVTATEKMEVVY